MGKPLGIYIHIPFCVSKCSYCDFYSLPGSKALMPMYLAALTKHMEESASRVKGYTVDTVYFGGGTPSLFGADNLLKVFSTLKRNYSVLLSSEVTLEANPESVDAYELKKLRRAGFNRISIGVQSANDELLHSIGRIHTFAQAEKAVEDARSAGFDNISLDLIYGLPGQTKTDWAETLARCAALKPKHLSCYGLKVEPGTPLARERDILSLPDDDAQADMYLYAVEALERYGYSQYEISNFAVRGFESKHNLKYWQRGDYLGFGPSAHSCVGNVRFAFVRNLREYITSIEENSVVVSEREDLSRLDQAVEYLMLGLRTAHGISAEEYGRIYRSDFAPLEKEFEFLQKKGLARCADGRWSLTPHGFLVSNSIIVRLLDIQAQQKKAVNMPWRPKASEFEEETDSLQLHF